MLSLNTSDEWGSSLDNQRQEFEKNIEARKRSQEYSEAIDLTFFWKTSAKSNDRFVAPRPKRKEKRTGTRSSNRQPESSFITETKKEEQLRIPVKSTTYDILLLMLTVSKQDAKVTEIDWLEFVGAMVNVGFSYTPRTGSEYIFAPGEEIKEIWNFRG